MITQDQEPDYVRLAEASPGMLCRETPPEILEACALDNEPTPFLEQFSKREFAPTLAWSTDANSRKCMSTTPSWCCGCGPAHTGLLGFPDPDLDKQFFSGADAAPS